MKIPLLSGLKFSHSVLIYPRDPSMTSMISDYRILLLPLNPKRMISACLLWV